MPYEPFLGEIALYPFDFPPRYWAFCDGQLLPIAQNTALFSLLGTTYGGDGRVTFGLPNLQARHAIGAGQGPGLSNRLLGEEGGAATVTLIDSEMPTHSHSLQASTAIGNGAAPAGKVVARAFGGGNLYKAGTTTQAMAPAALGLAGGSLPHNNLPPTLVLRYCIALQGIFPSRP